MSSIGQPVVGQIAAPGGVILGHIAGDVGELEGEAKVAGAVERVVVVGCDAHHHRHHHADRAGDVIAIAQQVGLAARAPVRGVEREAVDHVIGHGRRQPAFARDDAQRIEGRVAGRLRRQAPGRSGRGSWPAVRLDRRPIAMRAAMILPVGHVVAGAAPGIEQPDPLARGAVEQAAGERRKISTRARCCRGHGRRERR